GDKATKELFAAQNIKLSSMFNLPMPDNYTPYGGTPEEKQKALFKNAETKIAEIAEIVKAKKEHFDGTNTSAFRTHVHPGILYKMGYRRISIMDNSYTSDENCNGCSICMAVCPVDNITMKEKRPVWNNRCQQCYACLQWCPKESIQAGGKTVGIKRYHNPDITVKDIIAASAKEK
ncbi:MAG: 4Fe-4S ferredoxin, partial [bacterium]|nr:4Fe-4S ferredoxin [bacterium]